MSQLGPPRILQSIGLSRLNTSISGHTVFGMCPALVVGLEAHRKADEKRMAEGYTTMLAVDTSCMMLLGGCNGQMSVPKVCHSQIVNMVQRAIP